ncbi:MAG: hypothetical protein HC836_41055 [Richelia sp. RM2_1_2]|nr:hypothetical protein [Richelia sp. RM2_1_2]
MIVQSSQMALPFYKYGMGFEEISDTEKIDIQTKFTNNVIESSTLYLLKCVVPIHFHRPSTIYKWEYGFTLGSMPAHIKKLLGVHFCRNINPNQIKSMFDKIENGYGDEFYHKAIHPEKSCFYASSAKLVWKDYKIEIVIVHLPSILQVISQKLSKTYQQIQG